jgi:hypothetical protein
MHFVKVMIKRSRLKGGNVYYSVLPTNILLKLKGSINHG